MNKIGPYKVIFPLREEDEKKEKNIIRMNCFIDLYEHLFIPYTDCWRDNCNYLKNKKDEMSKGYYTEKLGEDVMLSFKMDREIFEKIKEVWELKKIKGKWKDYYHVHNGYVVT